MDHETSEWPVMAGAKKLGMVQGLLAEVRAKRVAMASIPPPTLKAGKAKAAPAGGGAGSRSAAARKAWATRRRG